ncbi:MAG TPA: hypothetical protein VH165_06920 [Kofleriaceae bacterium]|nr:hypothetical protein [Kofleriaceae bacterium]
MSIVLMTNNRWKIAEYRRFLERHAQELLVEPPTRSIEVIAGWLANARAVLADESNIFDIAGDLVGSDHVGPARNICRLHAWVNSPVGKIERRTYIREVAGQFDATKLRPDDPAVFDWDSAFTSTAGSTLEQMAAVGLKNSAREQCLSAFARAMLHHKTPKRLRWSEVQPASWSVEARLLTDHPLYRDLAPPLASALAYVVEQGVFFRGAKSRRDGNYWLPGLNGGLPYVPKGDPIHEATYMFHDVMHQLMPDLVLDGADTLDHKRVYIAYRMMSEGVSLVLADMLMVDGLARSGAHPGYDFTKRRIYPLYQALDPARREDLPWLLKQVTGFVLRGEPGELATAGEPWRAFCAKYTRFFVADFQWTRMNWQNLVARAAMVRSWIELVGPESFAAQGVSFISDVVQHIGRGKELPAMLEALFEFVWRRRLAPALAHPPRVDLERASSQGFRRWLTGQLAVFAHYAPVVAVPPLAHELAARIATPRLFSTEEIEDIRARFRSHVLSLAKDGVISEDDAVIYPDLFPLFDPFFLRDYDEAQQEFETVREASDRAFA